jgi:hypothetical protein
MSNRMKDFCVEFRFAGQTPQRLALGELLIQLEEQGVHRYKLEDIANSIARDGYFFGHHNYQRFAVFRPISDTSAPADLLILVREGAARTLLSDAPIDVTMVDVDFDPARCVEAIPVVVTHAEFQRVRSSVLSEIVRADVAEPTKLNPLLEPTPSAEASAARG